MKSVLIALTVASLGATAAFAEPRTRTTSFEGPNATGTRVTVRDPAAGTLSRDTSVTRTSDGATATRTYDRGRTESGVSASGSATGFGGKTRSFDYDRTRTDTGYTATGTATGRNGRTYDYSADRTRDGAGGFTANRAVTSGGTSLYNRNVVQTRSDGQVNRSVTSSRKAGYTPRRGPGRRR